MRKHRQWWLGFGLGIVVGALLLQIILYAEKQTQALTIAEGGKSFTQADVDAEVAKALEAAAMLPAEPTAEATGSPAASKEPTPSADPASDALRTAPSAKEPAAPEPSPPGEPTSSAPDAPKVAFYVSKGMDLKTVARSLKRLGVIDDVEDFVDAAREIDNKVEIGTSEFQGKPTYEEIIAELTRPKDD